MRSFNAVWLSGAKPSVRLSLIRVLRVKYTYLLPTVRIVKGALASAHDEHCVTIPCLVLLVLRIAPVCAYLRFTEFSSALVGVHLPLHHPVLIPFHGRDTTGPGLVLHSLSFPSHWIGVMFIWFALIRAIESWILKCRHWDLEGNMRGDVALVKVSIGRLY